MKRAEAKYFWIAVVNWRDPEKPSWIVSPKCVIAKDEEEAKITAMQEVSKDTPPANVQVIVRPF